MTIELYHILVYTPDYIVYSTEFSMKKKKITMSAKEDPIKSSMHGNRVMQVYIIHDKRK